MPPVERRALVGAGRLRRGLQEWRTTGKGWASDEWIVPSTRIYVVMVRDFSTFVVGYCTMRGLVGLRGGLALGPSLFSPTLHGDEVGWIDDN